MAQLGKLTQDETVDRIWELAETIGICMFVTWDGERQRARPVSARVRRKEHVIYFLTDEGGAKDDQVRDFPIVSLAFADVRANKYLAITGKAQISNDRAKIAEVFGTFDKAWWDSAEDPAIRLITFHPDDAELWDGAGRLRNAIALAAAAVRGARPDLGDNRKVGNL